MIVQGPDGAPELRIGRPTVQQVGSRIRYEVPVAAGYPAPDRLWFEVTGLPEGVSDRADAAAATLLMPAMMNGATLSIEGTVTAELVHQLRHGVQQVIQALAPELAVVEVLAAAPAPAGAMAPGVLTGFSAGIDSYLTLADYLWAADVPDSLRVTHLVYSHVGAHGKDGGARLFRDRLARIAPVVAQWQVPLVVVDSNAEDFYQACYPYLDFDRTHTIRNAAVAFLLQPRIGRLLYSSSMAFRDIAVTESTYMSLVEPVLLPQLSTPGSQLHAVGSEYTRVAKTIRVAELGQARSTLEVCSGQGRAGNCSICHKCLRTQLTLEIAGLLDRFQDVFDLARYRRVRQQYLVEVLTDPQHDPFLAEIRELAQHRGFRWPASAVWSGRSRRARSTVSRSVRSVQRVAAGLRTRADAGPGPRTHEPGKLQDRVIT